jgi:hypothetical protein
LTIPVYPCAVRIPGGSAPEFKDKSYSLTAEVDVPEACGWGLRPYPITLSYDEHVGELLGKEGVKLPLPMANQGTKLSSRRGAERKFNRHFCATTQTAHARSTAERGATMAGAGQALRDGVGYRCNSLPQLQEGVPVFASPPSSPDWRGLGMMQRSYSTPYAFGGTLGYCIVTRKEDSWLIS